MSKKFESVKAPAVIAVVHSSGNMGKSTIARYLLAPNMNGAPVFSVENRNTSAFEGVNGVEHLVAKQFRHLQDQIMIHERGVVDVGSSEFGDFSKHLMQYYGAHEDFCFIVPAGGRKKQIGDTAITIRMLKKIGVKPDQIRMVFNNIDKDDVDTLESDYQALFNLYDTEGGFILKRRAVIYRNDVFDLIKSIGMDLETILSDETDWREKVREANRAGDIEAQNHALQMIAAKRLAHSAKQNLDIVFVELFS
jgi:hypothetical protein